MSGANAPQKPRSILITGCSSGIGYAAAHTLHERGWQVVASARDAADVERLKDEGLSAVQLDLASPDSISIALDWTLKHTDGRLDALFNNGAFAIPGAVEDLPRNALAYQLDNGLLGWHDLTRRIVPLMRYQGYGRIVPRPQCPRGGSGDPAWGLSGSVPSYPNRVSGSCRCSRRLAVGMMQDPLSSLLLLVRRHHRSVDGRKDSSGCVNTGCNFSFAT